MCGIDKDSDDDEGGKEGNIFFFCFQIRDEIIELQAELLRYLHSHVESLNETIKDLERRNRRSQEYV